jgi:hypothetical protein
LVGWIRLNNPLVVADAIDVVCRSSVARERYLGDWVKKAKVVIRNAMEVVETAERKVYGKKSIFYSLGERFGRSSGIV